MEMNCEQEIDKEGADKGKMQALIEFKIISKQ